MSINTLNVFLNEKLLRDKKYSSLLLFDNFVVVIKNVFVKSEIIFVCIII